MPEQATPFTRHDLETKIIKRCWEDEAFRKEFTADPAAAFVKYLKVPAASLPKITVHQEEPGTWQIVLPAKPAKLSELSEEDLEKVSGGTTPACVATVASAVIGTLATAIVTGTVATATKDAGW